MLQLKFNITFALCSGGHQKILSVARNMLFSILWIQLFSLHINDRKYDIIGF